MLRKIRVFSLAFASQSCLTLRQVARSQSFFRKLRNSLNKKPSEVILRVSNWVQGLDLNQGPSGYEPDELPGCSTLQQVRGQRANRHSVCQRPFSENHRKGLPEGGAVSLFGPSCSFNPPLKPARSVLLQEGSFGQISQRSQGGPVGRPVYRIHRSP